MKTLKVLHLAICISVVFLVPLVIYLKNGTLEPWAFVLGALIGFSWYFFHLIPW